MQYFLPLLTLIFVGAKLLDHVDWSWWVVLSPFLFQVALSLLLTGGVFWLAWKNTTRRW